MRIEKLNNKTKSGISFNYVTLLLLLFIVGCNNDDPIHSGDLSEDIDNQEYVRIIKKNLSKIPKNTQVAIAVINNESTEFIGVKNENNTLRGANNADNIFEIGSITKVFTSVCLSKLVAINKASLNETLQSQFNFHLKTGSNITLQQLANHTSGLPRLPNNVNEIEDFNPENPYANYTYKNLKSYLTNYVTLNSTSGTKYGYSNLGTGILGYILANKMQKSYEKMLKEFIFNPLKMSSSTTLLENVDKSKLINGQDADGNPTNNWNFAETMTASGSIKSTVKDLEKFVRKNFEDDTVYNLPQQSTFEIKNNTKNLNASLGLGWNILEYQGRKVFLHDGGTKGYTSYLMMDKKNKKAVIILSNTYGLDESEEISDLASDFLEIISE